MPRHRSRANSKPASMRPGRFGPGDCSRWGRTRRRSARFNEARALRPGRLPDVTGPLALARRIASMRPGRFGPGDPRGARRCPRPSRSGFNEARALRPGRRRTSASWIRTTRTGFNEARALRPGRRRAEDVGSVVLDDASMRPGRFGPGDHARRRVLMSANGASMRPGRFGPGDHARRRVLMSANGASMRPGRFGPGDGEQHGRKPQVAHAASMRPGRFGPGDGPCLSRRMLRTRMLQ